MVFTCGLFFFFFVFQVEIEGLTGEIRFNEDGRRTNYTLNVVEMTVNSAMVKVAEWSDETGFVPIAAKYVRLRPKEAIERNKTYIVTTIVEEPYIIAANAEPGVILEGNRRYDGYCKDLADLIATKLGINCEYIALILFAYNQNNYLLNDTNTEKAFEIYTARIIDHLCILVYLGILQQDQNKISLKLLFICMICTIIITNNNNNKVTGFRKGFHETYDLCGSRIRPNAIIKKKCSGAPGHRYIGSLAHTTTYQITIQIMFNRFGYECHQTLFMLSTATLMR